MAIFPSSSLLHRSFTKQLCRLLQQTDNSKITELTQAAKLRGRKRFPEMPLAPAPHSSARTESERQKMMALRGGPPRDLFTRRRARDLWRARCQAALLFLASPKVTLYENVPRRLDKSYSLSGIQRLKKFAPRPPPAQGKVGRGRDRRRGALSIIHENIVHRRRLNHTAFAGPNKKRLLCERRPKSAWMSQEFP